MEGCSLRVPTWLADDAALAWHAPGGPLRAPYQWRRRIVRARAPEQHSAARLQEASPRTPDLSRVRPVVSQRWGDAHPGCPRGLAAMRLWHGTLLGVLHALRTSGVAVPFVHERLSNTPARNHEPRHFTIQI